MQRIGTPITLIELLSTNYKNPLQSAKAAPSVFPSSALYLQNATCEGRFTGALAKAADNVERKV